MFLESYRPAGDLAKLDGTGKILERMVNVCHVGTVITRSRPANSFAGERAWISERVGGILRRSMADTSFKAFVLDQLGALPELRAKAMFGGHGLYQASRFFGILMDGRLYFKTDEQTRTAYLERGMAPFIYEKARRTTTIHYFEVPPEVLENREELVAWAKRAIQAAATRP